MINTISNFNLDLFENVQNSAQGPSAAAPLKESFAALLLGIPVASVPVNAQAPAIPVEGPPQSETGKGEDAAGGAAPAIELPQPEDLCWGGIVPAPVKNDLGTGVLNLMHLKDESDSPIKLPPQENPAAGNDADIAALHRGRVVTGPVLPVKLPPVDSGISVSANRRPIMDVATPVKLPPAQIDSRDPAAVKQDIKNTSAPVLPIHLPPQDTLWSNEAPRDPNKKKDPAIQMLANRRPIMDPAPAQDTVSDTRPAAVKFMTGASYVPNGSPASGHVFNQVLPSTPIEVFIDGVETPPDPAETPVNVDMLLNDVEPAPPLTIPGFNPAGAVKTANPGTQTIPMIVDAAPAGGTDLAADPSKPEQKPLLRPQLPYEAPVSKSEKPLIRHPFQSAEAVKKADSLNLIQLLREVSFGFEPRTETADGPRLAFQSVRNALGEEVEFASALSERGIEAENNVVKTETGAGEAAEVFNPAFDRLRGAETASANEIKIERTAENLKQAGDVMDQVRPGLLELAALTAKRQEKQSMRMRLHPAELGTVDITLERNSAGAITAHFKTGTDGARQLLTNNLDQLRESLQNAGWQVGQLQVSSGSTPFTSSQDHSERAPREFEAARGSAIHNNSDQPDDTEKDAGRLLNLRA